MAAVTSLIAAGVLFSFEVGNEQVLSVPQDRWAQFLELDEPPIQTPIYGSRGSGPAPRRMTSYFESFIQDLLGSIPTSLPLGHALG
ncbi:MAG TPA: hypothetical protein VJL81_03650 [Solirubrobacterales bacterium]|nr:hypothetical protein [Solirubrobacterales bacterium]